MGVDFPGTLAAAGGRWQWKTEAAAGVRLNTGEKWWGTRIAYRRGTTGRWEHVTILDLHPLELAALELALRQWIETGKAALT